MDAIYIGCGAGLFKEGLELLFKNNLAHFALSWACDIAGICRLAENGMPRVLIIDPVTFSFEDSGKESVSVGVCLDKLRETYDSLPIVAMYKGKSPCGIKPLAAQGFDGFLFMDKPFSEAVYAIEAMIRGAVYFPSEVADSLLNGYAAASDKLTKREYEVLKLICDGYTSKEISYSLHIAVSTVDVYRKRILRKTSSNSIAGLVRFAIKSGYIAV